MTKNDTLDELLNVFWLRPETALGDPKWKFLENLDRGRFSDNIRQARAKYMGSNV